MSPVDDHHSHDHVALLQAMRTSGGFEVSLLWDECRLERAEIKSLLGNPLVIQTGDSEQRVYPTTTPGKVIVIE